MRERDELTVVDDQVGSPTWAWGLAEVLWLFAERADLAGIWHWSDGGSCTWYEWATTIQQQAVDRGLLERIVPIRAVSTSEYPTPATRPAFSVLDSSATCTALAIQQVPWEDTLGTMLDQMATPASL
jgi:dTDP-4-dehydrorhamnose reductase